MIRFAGVVALALAPAARADPHTLWFGDQPTAVTGHDADLIVLLNDDSAAPVLRTLADAYGLQLSLHPSCSGHAEMPWLGARLHGESLDADRRAALLTRLRAEYGNLVGPTVHWEHGAFLGALTAQITVQLDPSLSPAEQQAWIDRTHLRAHRLGPSLYLLLLPDSLGWGATDLASELRARPEVLSVSNEVGIHECPT